MIQMEGIFKLAGIAKSFGLEDCWKGQFPDNAGLAAVQSDLSVLAKNFRGCLARQTFARSPVFGSTLSER